MPFSGGVYTAPSNSWNPAVAGANINAGDWAAQLADLQTALSTCMLKDGTQLITQNIPMGGFKLTGLPAGTVNGDSLRYEQLTGQYQLLSTYTAKGDIVAATASAATARTGVGADGTHLVADSTQTNGVNWLPNGFTTGDAKLTLKTVADTGWVMMNDGTIGDASSGGTTRANADTSALFSLLWANTANGDCPVSGGRGVSAAADFAAHKTITLPLVLGRSLASSGAGSGLTSRALAHVVGEETHQLTTGELAAHTHTYNAGANDGTLGVGGGAVGFYDEPSGANTGSNGSGTGHNTMQPTSFLNVMIKL